MVEVGLVAVQALLQTLYEYELVFLVFHVEQNWNAGFGFFGQRVKQCDHIILDGQPLVYGHNFEEVQIACVVASKVFVLLALEYLCQKQRHCGLRDLDDCLVVIVVELVY